MLSKLLENRSLDCLSNLDDDVCSDVHKMKEMLLRKWVPHACFVGKTVSPCQPYANIVVLHQKEVIAMRRIEPFQPPQCSRSAFSKTLELKMYYRRFETSKIFTFLLYILLALEIAHGSQS